MPQRGVQLQALGDVGFSAQLQDRLGTSLNEHVRLQVCAVDGVLEAVATEEIARTPVAVCRVNFHPTTVCARSAAQGGPSVGVPLRHTALRIKIDRSSPNFFPLLACDFDKRASGR